jgi:hypothetical protein
MGALPHCGGRSRIASRRTGRAPFVTHPALQKTWQSEADPPRKTISLFRTGLRAPALNAGSSQFSNVQIIPRPAHASSMAAGASSTPMIRRPGGSTVTDWSPHSNSHAVSAPLENRSLMQSWVRRSLGCTGGTRSSRYLGDAARTSFWNGGPIGTAIISCARCSP